MDRKPDSDDYLSIRKLLPRSAPKTEGELDMRVHKMQTRFKLIRVCNSDIDQCKCSHSSRFTSLEDSDFGKRP